MNLCVWCFAEHQNILNMADRDAGLETKKRERPDLRLGHSPVVFLTETTIRHQDE